MKIYVRQEIGVPLTFVFVTSDKGNEHYKGIQFCFSNIEEKVELYTTNTDVLFCKESLESNWKLIEL